MLGATRRDRLLNELLRNGGVTVSALSEDLQVSEATIRRDLELLEQEGLLRRTHGGAVVVDTAGALELSVREKSTLNIEEKRRIGLAAAALIESGHTIALNGGTTTAQVARSIRHHTNVTVVTNAVNVVLELAKRPGITLISTGGRLRANSLELVGPLAEHTLREIYVDKAFIGVNGFTPEHGLTTFDETEALTNRAMIRAARRVIVVADHTKLNRVAFSRIGTIDQVHTLITDAGADPEVLAALRRAGLEVIAV
ncbi:MAG: DeoR/GlpR transcriptional regulator [Chloroflexi bacterium]|nr:DeoR/GlpR transcriptional regulator [Chloroflexota bacterium]